MTLAVFINTAVALIALGTGVWFVLAGAVGLAFNEPEAVHDAVGQALFIRLCVALIVGGLVLFAAGSIVSIRLML